MADILETYRKAAHAVPDRRLAWQLHDAGLENLGVERQPETLPVPEYGPNGLLVRVDAAGLCFSDIKIITQGGAHPRLYGRDLSREPIIPGHESALTVVGVGENLKERFHVGERFIVQADIYYRGVGLAYGYMLPGALAQYGIIGTEILEGDEGCYLLPVQDTTGYVEAALTEPWACVEASYRIRHRESLKPGGIAWFIGSPGAAGQTYTASHGLEPDAHPAKILVSDVPEPARSWLSGCAAAAGAEWVEVDGLTAATVDAAITAQVGEDGIDDLIILGAAAAEMIQNAAYRLAKGGICNLVATEPLGAPVQVDVGRIHYDNLAFIGTTGQDIAAAYTNDRQPSEWKPGGTLWVVGAGGPMGQMHVQRAVDKADGPRLVIASDIASDRLASVERRARSRAQERGVTLRCLNPTEMEPEAFEAALWEATDGVGFDDIVVLVPVPRVISDAAAHLGPNGVLNIFAGVPKGTLAALDLAAVYQQNVRFVGSSGSTIRDLKDTLAKTESQEIRPNASVAAIGGMKAAWEGIDSVKGGRFPGKIVIFPQIPDLGLIPLTELEQELPTVAAKLGDGLTWTKEAEEELLRVKLGNE
jgi:threonine dehydrogenase-like Zn-dependent dehydrogenase